MKGGAVALDGRIEPGDMILQVNDISFENLKNDKAVEVLKEAVNQKGYFDKGTPPSHEQKFEHLICAFLHNVLKVIFFFGYRSKRKIL